LDFKSFNADFCLFILNKEFTCYSFLLIFQSDRRLPDVEIQNGRQVDVVKLILSPWIVENVCNS